MTFATLILLNIVQGTALCEIYFAWRKWINSPTSVTALQTLARIFIVILIDYMYADVGVSLNGVNPNSKTLKLL